MSVITKKAPSSYYVFDTQSISNRVDLLRRYLPKKVDLCYAVKANPFVIKEIDSMVERLEVCSPGEGEICQKLAILPEKMVISGVYKTPEYIEQLVSDETGDYIYTIESITQLELLDTLSKHYQKKLKVLIRLSNTSQFGIDEESIDDIIVSRLEYSYLDFLGIQYFSGTQKYSLKKYARELQKLDAYLWHLEHDFGFQSRELEYGTGFPVTYFESDDFNEEELLKGFSELLTQMTYKTHITLELGRSLVASCGEYYTPVVDIKTTKNQRYAMVDGGMHHINYFGQYMGIKIPSVSVLGKEQEEKNTSFMVCGSLCTMNDILVKDLLLPELTIGDFLVFKNAGAYSMTEGMSLFLSRDLPSVFIRTLEGNLFKVRDNFETSQLNHPNY